MATSTSASSSAPTPTVRTFQMDGSAQGNLASSVNLFRGDVNLNQQLFTLQGRSPDGLDVSIAIQYQSNIFREATTWSADAPTGILGLGWSLPLTWIEASGGSAVAATRQYVFNDNGCPNQLFRQPLVPILFTMSYVAGLSDGVPLPTAIRDAFRGQGLAISTGAIVHGSGPWTISDDALMQSFVLSLEGGMLVARDGGELYQLQNYQFWKVLYYPTYERWVVVSEKGVRRSLGGRTADTSLGFATSLGNSIAWSVSWADASGRPSWTGPCGDAAGQVQVARAWYLYELRDRFGSTVTTTYNGVARGAAGILPGVEQQVGTGGKPYTKAVYLDTITDTVGRRVHFTYGQKLWGAGTIAPREYFDPHRATPSNDPGPYQDRYETQYLASIEVSAASGNPLYSFAFDYAPRPSLSGAERAVANVTTYTDSRQGDTYKRFLTSVTQKDQDGTTAPSLRFSYDLGTSTTGGQPGALLSVTQPQGGTANYTYVKHDLPLCDRLLSAVRPGSVPAGASPRTFYGPDYVAVCYYNQTSLELSLEVYTWTGRWLRWTPSPSEVIDNQGLLLGSLVVNAQSDFLAVSFNRPSGDLPIYIYQRDVARPGQWRPATVDGVTAAQNQPTLLSRAQSTPVQIRGGNTFLIVAQNNLSASPPTCRYDVLTWRWSSQSWTHTTASLPQMIWITAGPEWYAILGQDSTLSLTYLDGNLDWHAGGSAAIANLQTADVTSIRMTAGAGLVAIANRTGGSQANTYTLSVAQWNADYALTVSQFGPYTDSYGVGNAALSWTPTVVADTLVAVNGNLLRRSGSGWKVDTSLNPGATPPANTTQRFTYGLDTAVRVLAPSSPSGAVKASVLSYDPVASAWAGYALPDGSLIVQSVTSDNWPSAGGGDWLFVGPYGWFRGTATAWTQVLATTPTLNLNSVAAALATSFSSYSGTPLFQSDSLVNEAPGFISFTVSQSGNLSTQSVILRNGSWDQGSSSMVLGEKIYTPTSGGVGGVGVSPTGPRLFTSYSASCANIDQAQTLSVRHYAGYAVQGPITHYTVTKCEIGDGFGSVTPTSYGFDISTATSDASGNVIKFYTNTTYPGSAAASSAPYGRVVNKYLNGVMDQTGDNFYDMLDGLLVSTETRSAADVVLESTQSTWVVVQQVASSPTDAAARPVQLRGGWVTQTQQQSMKDGLTTLTTTDFKAVGLSLPLTGQPVIRSRASIGGSGSAETFTETTHHGVQLYPSLWAIHALVDVAQSEASQQPVGGAATLLSSRVYTYSSWASNAGDRVKTPATTASFSLSATNVSSFPFSSWTPGQTPSGWVLNRFTTARTPSGRESGCVDGTGCALTTLYDAGSAMTVATIGNAAPGECAYLGFQDYEDMTGWALTGVTFDKTDVCSGSRAAVLGAGGVASITGSVQPQRADTWLVGCRYRTPAGFVADASGLTARVDLGGGQSSVVTLPWAGTNNAWSYVTAPVTVGSVAKGSGTVTLTVTNTTASAVSIDCLLLAPLVTSATLRTYDPDSQQALSAMDAGGRTNRTAFDRSFRTAISVGAGGLVREISGSFSSRRGSTNDTFSAASPNAEVTLHSAGGGVLESFRDGGRWQGRWQPALASDWNTSSGALVHKSATASPLTWKTQPTGTYAIYFEPQTTDPAAVISVSAGDIQVKWSSAGGWSAQQGTMSWPRVANPVAAATHWLLVVGDGVVCFCADGQLVFSRGARPAGSAVVLNITGSVKLRNLTGVQDIRLGVSYNDAIGRQRQVHQLLGGDSQVCALVFDPLNRQVATTRSAPGSFGTGASFAPLSYRASFLNVGAFLTAMATTWDMSGDIADYYRGQLDGTVTRSDDQGYPYWGVRYEASPRSVQLETSLPGKDFAINLSVAAAQRQTVQFSYGVNGAAIGAMPQGQYSETRVTSPLKSVSSRLTDRLGQQVAMSFADSSGAVANRSTGARSFAAPSTGPSATLEQQQPNSQLGGPQPASTAFKRTIAADALQQTTRISDPDVATTSFIYDSAGRLRFVQPAMGAGEQWYVFYRYDAIGRIVAEGYVAGAWDPIALQQNADNRLWPAGSDPTVTVMVSTDYDGTGGDPTLIGQKWRTTAKNAAPSSVAGAGNVTVKEELAYAADGNVARVTQTVSGAVSASGVLGYAYNVLGEVVRVDLPTGCPIASIYYGYDDHGSVVKVGTSAGGAELGLFGYSVDRKPQTWTVSDWSRAISYTSQGWVKSAATRSSAGTQSFTQSLAYQADGAMTSRGISYAFSNFSFNYNDTFAYDNQRRLASATGGSNIQALSYDPNGNLWSMTHAGKVSSFPCATGTNRVQSASVDGSAATGLTWNARGQLLTGLGRSLEYLPVIGRTRAITSGTTQLALAYGGVQQRVVKQNVGANRVNVYFHGAGQVPIAILSNGSWGVTVHGPMGPLAFISDRTYYLLCDATHSVWGAVANGALSFATAWTPFGAVGASFGDSSVVPYGFQGHEWDREVGLHNFRARLYDAVLCRFLAPDPQAQFASPYVFAGNNPLTAFDPTGELSLWARIGIGIAMAAIGIAGIALTVATAGTATVGILGAESALMTTATAGLSGAGAVAAAGMETAAATTTTALATAALGGGGFAVAAGAAGSAELAAGAWMGLTAAACIQTVAGATLVGTGVAGLQYDVQHGRNFSAKAFGETLGIAAASSFITGVLFCPLLPFNELNVGLTEMRQVVTLARLNAAKSAYSGAVNSGINTILTNAVEKKPWYQNVVQNTVKGAATGAISGHAGSKVGSMISRPEIFTADLVERRMITDQMAQKLNTLPELVMNAAESEAGKMTGLMAAYFVGMGWLLWGAATGEC